MVGDSRFRARLLRFGPFEADARSGELRKHGIRIKLREQPFQILLTLLEHPGEVVLREEIRWRLWPNNTVVEFDHGINAAIQKLRDALGESAENPRYVETVARRGYRFLGEVERVGQAEPVAVTPPQLVPVLEPGDLAGRTVSHYRILGKLGAGGMGVVYQADDLTLGRRVALKFLPVPAREAPESAILRFEEEARAASALNHPNICTIYGFEKIGDQPMIAMELVEGQTLQERLANGPVAPDLALKFAIQITSALAEAHRKGIVHRDLKPGNIMLTKSGVKVLDFGLAKIERNAVAADQPGTPAGTVQGTLPYMSPEQLRGEEVDTRSDIFSFGVVLYEMLAGRGPFEAQNAAGLTAAILECKPPSLADSMPAVVERVVRRCLAKCPDERWQTARDLQAELEWITEAPAMERPASTGTRPARKVDGRWIAIAALVGLASVLFIALLQRKPNEPRAIRFNIYPPEGAPFGAMPNPVVSPDGKSILYVTTWKLKNQLWLRALDSTESVPLLGTEGSTLSIDPPFWSPDSRSIAFFADGMLKRLDIDRPGGPGEVVTICEAPNARGGSWSREGIILVSMSSGLIYRVGDTGGSPKPVTRLDESRREMAHHSPWFLPDGRHFLYSAIGPPFPGRNRTIRVASLDSPESKVLMQADSQATFARGHIFFVTDDTLQAQPFNPRTLTTTGEAFGVANRITFAFRLSPFSVAEEGPLVYASNADTPRYELVWFDRSGNRLSTLTEARVPELPIYHPQLSPNRETLAYATFAKELTDLGLYDLGKGLPMRFTSDAGGPIAPVWSPDGQSIAYASVRDGHFDIFQKSVYGSGKEELLYADDDDKYPTSWSPDGRFLLFDRSSYKKPRSIWILPLTADLGSRKPAPLAQSPAGEGSGEFSPDGRWIVYTSYEPGGAIELCLVPFGPEGASLGRKTQLSRSGGNMARWRKDGKEIFYRKGRSLVAAAVTLDSGAVQIGKEQELIGAVSIFGYDVSSDGRKFLLCLRTRQISTQPLTVVENWLQARQKTFSK